MNFAIKGIEKGPKMAAFHREWFAFTAHENMTMFRKDFVSPAQVLVIDLFCGEDEPYENSGEMTIWSNEPAQAELEALFRARGRALANALHRGDIAVESAAHVQRRG